MWWLRLSFGGLCVVLGGFFLSGKVLAVPEFWSPVQAFVFLVVGAAIVFRVDAFLHDWLNHPLNCGAPERLFQMVANDPRFLELADLDGSVNLFRTTLADAQICYSVPWQGGYAGYGPDGQVVVLGLSHLNLRPAPAAHELFHLVRHVRGFARFETNSLSVAIREEVIVWTLTLRYDLLGGVRELLPKFVILGSGVAAFLHVIRQFY
jgi:hypothetical protein